MFVKCSIFLQFYDAWSGLCSWLDEGERTLKKYGTGSPAKVKQDMDELKVPDVGRSLG